MKAELDKMLLGKAAGKGLALFLSSGLADVQCRVREKGSETFVDVLPELLLLTADLVVETVVVCWRVVDPAELCVRVEVLLEVELWLRLLMAGAFLLPELSR